MKNLFRPWKLEITCHWRSFKPNYRWIPKYKQLHLMWLWFFICIEWDLFEETRFEGE